MSGAGFELGFLDASTGAGPYVRRGAGLPTQLLVIQPLFEERNRLRRLLAATTRRLADAGIGSWMFDLPCTGDDAGLSADASWAAWLEAVAMQAEHVRSTECSDIHILSARGGCLFDHIPARSHYRLAPVAGERLLRDLLRSRAAGQDAITMATLELQLSDGETIELGGFPVGAGLATDLRRAVPQPVARLRTAVVGDVAGDIALPGPPLWRQAEPADEPVLADALAADVARWTKTCGAH